MRRTITRSLAAAAVAVVIGGFAAPSYAGEVTGNGKSLKQPDGTLHGASICAFSGINDNFTGDKNMPPDEDGFTRVQSWGQLDQAVRAFLTTIGLHPGDACPPGTEEP